jgi:hypothetical protein
MAESEQSRLQAQVEIAQPAAFDPGATVVWLRQPPYCREEAIHCVTHIAISKLGGAIREHCSWRSLQNLTAGVITT